MLIELNEKEIKAALKMYIDSTLSKREPKINVDGAVVDLENLPGNLPLIPVSKIKISGIEVTNIPEDED